jgi:hypothetical protein
MACSPPYRCKKRCVIARKACRLPFFTPVCWVSVLAAIPLLTVGLWNATLAPSEKGFYAMSFVLGLFAVVAVQKNVRDLEGLSDRVPQTVVETIGGPRGRVLVAHLEKCPAIPTLLLSQE